MEEEKKQFQKEELNQKVEENINKIVEEGIQPSNLEMLYKLVDIHKDIANEEYWKIKEEVYNMRYNEYGEYEGYGRRGVPGSGRRYRGYGRRGVKGTGRGRYRGEEAMEEMQEHFENYNEANEEYNEGNYGAEGGMIKSVEGIMENVYKIVEEIAESDNPEVMHIIKKYSKKMGEI